MDDTNATEQSVADIEEIKAACTEAVGDTAIREDEEEPEAAAKRGGGAPVSPLAALLMSRKNKAAAAPTEPKMAAVARAKQADIVHKSAQRVYLATRAAADLSQQYNAKAKELDPELFAQINQFAADNYKNRTIGEAEMVSKILDTSNAARTPELDGFRARMEKLAEKEELARIRQELREQVNVAQDNSKILAGELGVMQHANPEGVAKLRDVLDKHVVQEARKIEPLVAEKPSEEPNKMLKQLLEITDGLGDKLKELAERLVNAVSALLGRGPK
jgi:hypothetical protein